MSKNLKKIPCPICIDSFTTLDGLYLHLAKEHSDEMPKDFSPSRYYYYVKTGRTHGTCVVCKKDTPWNDSTNKYHRFCGNPKCKEKYVAEFQKRMIGKYGKTTLLKDPEVQRKMLANRKISGEYTWSTGNNLKKVYSGSYELDFIKMLDVFMDFDYEDVMTPSPHTYYYMYQGEEHFYIPDVFIPSLNLEIEIKDGGNNPNTHHKIQAVDKVKEKLKDEVMASVKEFDYIKLVNKEYGPLFDYLNNAKFEAMSVRPVVTTEASVMPTAVTSDSVPVYIVLSSNNTEFAKVIRKVTKQHYSHAAISLDSSLNDMYSFSSVPFTRGLSALGFTRESIYSPNFASNIYFSVEVMFVTKKEYADLKTKLSYFKKHYDKYEYNTPGLIEYILKLKSGKGYNENKLSWFCSEFVSYIINDVRPGVYDNFLITPDDLKRSPDLYSAGTYTLDTFDEDKLNRAVKNLKRAYTTLSESNELVPIDESIVVSNPLGGLSIRWNTKLIKKYTTFIDWKRIKDEYSKLFEGDQNINRFNLVEIIVYKKMIRDKITFTEDNVTEFIIAEMNKIKLAISAGAGVVISHIDTGAGLINYIIGAVHSAVAYPLK